MEKVKLSEVFFEAASELKVELSSGGVQYCCWAIDQATKELGLSENEHLLAKEKLKELFWSEDEVTLVENKNNPSATSWWSIVDFPEAPLLEKVFHCQLARSIALWWCYLDALEEEKTLLRANKVKEEKK